MKADYRFGRSQWRTLKEGLEKEWLITNGIGGYANQTVTGANSRLYSAYLNVSLNPPADRYTVLSNTFESIYIAGKEVSLAAQEYLNYAKEGQQYLNVFQMDAVPEYTYQVGDITIKKTIALEYGKNTAVVCFDIETGIDEVDFCVTPLFTCKPLGSIAERSDLVFERTLSGTKLTLIPEKKKDMPIYVQISEGEYRDRSLRPVSMATPNYLIDEGAVYAVDNRMGFHLMDFSYTPYDIWVKVKKRTRKQIYLRCSVEGFDDKEGFSIVKECKDRKAQLLQNAAAGDGFADRLVWSSDAFLTERKSTGLKTILAGYPWFLDWGRDTMIAFTGTALCTKRYKEAREILLSFMKYLKHGMIPNVFPGNSTEEPAYNTIDGTLWYFYAVYQYLQYTGGQEDAEFVEQKLYSGMEEMIEAYQKGTDFHIHMEEDGLVSGGSSYDQLTWMDVRVGEWVVTPRHGKPVEVNALWYNALCIMKELAERFGKDGTRYENLAAKVKKSFQNAFWNEKAQCLYDVLEQKPDGSVVKDDKIRPNQIFAVSLPFMILSREQEISVVEVVYQQLYTPYGIRSLSPKDPEYKKQYVGELSDRDAAYHMGTAWGYISGAFISAYCKVHDHSKEAVGKAFEMCRLFEDHMQDGCLGGIAEVFDGDNTCTSRGCYTQAWSVAEVLRCYMEDVLPYREN